MKFIFSLLLSLCLTVSLASAQQPALKIDAKSYILVDYRTGQSLADHDAKMRIEPASLTKLMTAYVTFSALQQKHLTLTQVISVSEQAWSMIGSRMFIEPNKSVTVDELIRGMIVQSGNDACIALAEAIAGSEEIFVHMMNKEALRLGMKNTNFTNSTGLPDNHHYSTAYDLAILAAAIIRDFPEYYPLYSLKEFTYNDITQPNRNRLLWLDPHVDGLKTGWTKTAGYCLITSAKRDQQRLISVIIGADSAKVRSIESQRLLNYGFQFFDSSLLYKKDQEVTTIQLWKGAQNVLKAGFNQDIHFSLPRGQAEKIKATMEYKQPLIAPINKGQDVGTVKFTVDGQPLATYPLVALENVGSTNMFGRAWDSLQLLFK